MNTSYLPREKFEPIKYLGKGHFGVVMLANNKLLDRVEAVKEIHLADAELFESALEEAKKLEKLKHRNIVEIYDAGYLEEDMGIYISMEYLENGSAADLGFFSMPRLKLICSDVLSALEYAHSRDYIHRDIKPSNILISGDGTAKLSDFGIATKLDAVGTADPFGYWIHIAPEALSHEDRYSVYSDIYSMGVTIHRMINGDPPNLCGNVEKLVEYIRTGKYPPRENYRPDVPPRLARLINKAMELSPTDRFGSAGEMANELTKIKVKCEWILKGNNHWVGKTEGKVIDIFYSGKNGEITTMQKRKDAKSFRRINELCFECLNPAKVNKKLARILRGFESGLYR